MKDTKELCKFLAKNRLKKCIYFINALFACFKLYYREKIMKSYIQWTVQARGTTIGELKIYL